MQLLQPPTISSFSRPIITLLILTIILTIYTPLISSQSPSYPYSPLDNGLSHQALNKALITLDDQSEIDPITKSITTKTIPSIITRTLETNSTTNAVIEEGTNPSTTASNTTGNTSTTGTTNTTSNISTTGINGTTSSIGTTSTTTTIPGIINNTTNTTIGTTTTTNTSNLNHNNNQKMLLSQSKNLCPKEGANINDDIYKESSKEVRCPYERLKSKYFPYYVSQIEYSHDNTYEIYTLDYCNIEQMNWISNSSPIIKKISLIVYYMKDDVINIKFIDPNNSRWEIPHEEPFPYFKYQPMSNRESSLFDVIINNGLFTFKIIRKSTKEAIFDIANYDFIYSDKYLELTTNLPTPNIYGLGERAYKFNLGPTGVYTLFNKDQPWLIENGKPGNGLYGSHPMYLQRESKSNIFSIVYLRNSNAMDIALNKGKTLTYRVIGGIFDFVLFCGDQYPETVTIKYHEYIGGWKLFPFWSHGFHQCKWGYKTITEVLEVINKYNTNDLPLDAIWNDIDYMDRRIDFTIDNFLFPSSKINSIYEKKQKHWVPIIDAGIGISSASPEFVDGVTNNVFIKDKYGQYVRGSVWPGAVYFPDYFNPNTTNWWIKSFKNFRNKAKFSGIWIDMNEVANFCDGLCDIFYNTCDGEYDHLPYYPGYTNLTSKTIVLDANHYSTNGTISEYNAHNLFGNLQSKATHEYLLEESNLTFVLSRSTAPGTGKYAAHWLGDNASTWEWLRNSISGIFSFNLFGIPMVGADICGFNLRTTIELCARWIQLGAFYPFARNHNHIESPPQELYALGSLVTKVSRNALKLRYSMLKYYYSLFIKKNSTGTIFRPVFYEFPNIQELYNMSNNYIDEQFMIGESLMVLPVLYEHTTSVKGYFPQEDWYNFYTGELIHSANEKSKVYTVKAHFESNLPLFIRGGHIIHVQETNDVLKTDDLDHYFELLIAFKNETVNDPNVKYARGYLMSIQDFTNDTNILTRCYFNNCLLYLQAYYIMDITTNLISIDIEFNHDNKNNEDNSSSNTNTTNTLDDIGIFKLSFYGISYVNMVNCVVMLNNKQVLNTEIIESSIGITNFMILDDLVIRSGDILTIRQIQ